MPKFKYALTNGKTLTLEGDTQPDDEIVAQHAKDAGVELQPAEPFDVKKQNAVMRANMAKQPPGTGEQDLLTDFATSGPMGNFNEAMGAAGRGEGAKAIHQAVVGTSKVLAPVAPFAIAAAPLVAVGGLAGGVIGDVAARRATSLVTDNPDYQDVAGDVGGLVGGGAGAKLAGATPVEPVLRFAGSELSKGAGGMSRLVGRGITAATDAADEAGARLRGPMMRLFQPSQQSVNARNAAALADAATIESDVTNAHRDEAIATNRHMPRSVPQLMRDTLPGTAGQDAVVPVPDRGGAPQAGPVGTGQERLVDQPLYAQQALQEAGASREPAVTPSGRTPTPTHTQAGGRGREFIVKAPKDTSLASLDLSSIPDGKNARPSATGAAVVEGAAGPNASGDSAASREALSRMAGMKARGEEFVVKKGNAIRKLVGPEAVDYTPQPGEVFGVRAKDGSFRPLSEGEVKEALTASRKAGAMPIAMRRALFNELRKRSGQ